MKRLWLGVDVELVVELVVKVVLVLELDRDDEELVEEVEDTQSSLTFSASARSREGGFGEKRP